MKGLSRKIIVAFVSLWVTIALAALGSAQEYEALEEVEKVDTIFDFRDSDPESAAAHLQLIHDTYNDPVVRETSEEPDFVVVFMDASVKLLSSEVNEYSDEEREILSDIDNLISTLAGEGVRLEICEVAVSYFDVDIDTVSPEIERVKNGWISSMGYQLKDYALIPVY